MKRQIDRGNFDARLRETIGLGHIAEAATCALEAYGDEIYSLLAALHRGEGDAAEVFSLFCEQLWRALPSFEGRSSFRTWAYAIAWHASARVRTQHNRRREVLMTHSEFEEMAQHISSSQTGPGREKRSRLRELRESLPSEDQSILILRVERELDWRDLARVMNEGQELDDQTLERESARLRKRFQSIKERLRQMAEKDAQ